MLLIVWLLFLVGSVVCLPQRSTASNDGAPEALPGNGTLNPEGEEKIFEGIKSQYRYTFYVAIMQKQEDGSWDLLCGGSLIGASSVLTAGHCTIDFKKGDQLEAWINPSTQLSQQPRQRIKISRAATSPNYDAGNVYNDIGIYSMSKPATLDERVATICIGSYSNYNNINVELVGFGKTGCRDTSSTSNVLLYAKGTTISADKCVSTRDDIQNTANQVCANLRTPGYAEQGGGDSGGPLFGKSNGKFTQIGLVSYNLVVNSQGCPDKTKPGVYTIPAMHMNFIKSRAMDAAIC